MIVDQAFAFHCRVCTHRIIHSLGVLVRTAFYMMHHLASAANDNSGASKRNVQPSNAPFGSALALEALTVRTLAA